MLRLDYKSYIWHKLTLYHFRHSLWTHLAWKLDKKLPGSYSTSLAFCSCGWRCWWSKKVRLSTFCRWVLKCSWRHCKWDEPSKVETGPIYQDEEGEWHSAIDEGPEEEVIVLGEMSQCERCYRIRRDK